MTYQFCAWFDGFNDNITSSLIRLVRSCGFTIPDEHLLWQGSGSNCYGCALSRQQANLYDSFFQHGGGPRELRQEDHVDPAAKREYRILFAELRWVREDYYHRCYSQPPEHWTIVNAADRLPVPRGYLFDLGWLARHQKYKRKLPRWRPDPALGRTSANQLPRVSIESMDVPADHPWQGPRVSMYVSVDAKCFECSLRVFTWQAVDNIDSVDATVMIRATASNPSTDLQTSDQIRIPRTVEIFLQGHVRRQSRTAPFLVDLSDTQVAEILQNAFSELEPSLPPKDEGQTAPHVLRIAEGRWLLQECRIAKTNAPMYAGSAGDIVDKALSLTRHPLMEDWEIELADSDRIAEFCAFYDTQTDPIIKFDVMALALASFDGTPDLSIWSDWFERTLIRDFAIHGHTVAYWCVLEQVTETFLQPDPEFCFTITPLMRKVWTKSQVRVNAQFL
jgi:hypothetical protein